MINQRGFKPRSKAAAFAVALLIGGVAQAASRTVTLTKPQLPLPPTPTPAKVAADQKKAADNKKMPPALPLTQAQQIKERNDRLAEDSRQKLAASKEREADRVAAQSIITQQAAALKKQEAEMAALKAQMAELELSRRLILARQAAAPAAAAQPQEPQPKQPGFLERVFGSAKSASAPAVTPVASAKPRTAAEQIQDANKTIQAGVAATQINAVAAAFGAGPIVGDEAVQAVESIDAQAGDMFTVVANALEVFADNVDRSDSDSPRSSKRRHHRRDSDSDKTDSGSDSDDVSAMVAKNAARLAKEKKDAKSGGREAKDNKDNKHSKR
jgi:hypothetical protein